MRKKKKEDESLESQPKGYPPKDPGIRVISLEEVREQQKNLEMKLKLALGLGDELYDELVSPLIDNLARIVHLLPASQNHHHNGIGGLFRHSLEVAYNTVQGTEGVVMVSFFDGTPRSRRAREERWRVTAAFAGMAHDLGKVHTDLRVTDEDGEKWRAVGLPLYDWLEEKDLDRYFVQFQPGRKGKHEEFTAEITKHLWTDTFKEWLLEEGDEIYAIVNGMLAGSRFYEDSQLAQLVIRADQRSVEHDLKAQPSQSSPFGVTLAQSLVDGMRLLVQQKSWRVNQPGGRVWATRDGSELFAYVVWHQGAKELSTLLIKDKVQGVPRHEATLADIMFEAEIAIPYDGPSGHSRYWPITSQYTPGSTLYTLKFPANVIFPDVEPACIDIKVVDPHAEPHTAEDDEEVIAETEHQANESRSEEQADGDDESDIPRMLDDDEGDSHAALIETALVKRSQGDKSEQVQPKGDSEAAVQTEKKSAERSTAPAQGSPHVAEKSADTQSSDTAADKTKNNSTQAKSKSDRANGGKKSRQSAPTSTTRVTEAEQWLKRNGDTQGKSSQWLIDIAKGDWDGKIEKAGRRVHLIWPKAAETYAGKYNELITLLYDAGWIESGGGGGKIQNIDGQRVLVVKPRPARLICVIGSQGIAP